MPHVCPSGVVSASAVKTEQLWVSKTVTVTFHPTRTVKLSNSSVLPPVVADFASYTASKIGRPITTYRPFTSCAKGNLTGRLVFVVTFSLKDSGFSFLTPHAEALGSRKASDTVLQAIRLNKRVNVVKRAVLGYWWPMESGMRYYKRHRLRSRLLPIRGRVLILLFSRLLSTWKDADSDKVRMRIRETAIRWLQDMAHPRFGKEMVEIRLEYGRATGCLE